MSSFQPLQVVDRGSETQPEIVENVNKLTRVNSYQLDYMGWGVTHLFNNAFI